MRRLTTLGRLISVVVLASALAAPPASGSISQDHQQNNRAKTGYYAPLSAEDTGMSIMAESAVITAGTCKYRQAVDNPHESGGDVSVHGWWVIEPGSGKCPTYANVDIKLEAKFCNHIDCTWRLQASSSKDVLAGGGSGRRATARRQCADSRTVGYRGVVDVDLIGVSDPGGVTYNYANVACYPTS